MFYFLTYYVCSVQFPIVFSAKVFMCRCYSLFQQKLLFEKALQGWFSELGKHISVALCFETQNGKASSYICKLKNFSPEDKRLVHYGLKFRWPLRLNKDGIVNRDPQLHIMSLGSGELFLGRSVKIMCLVINFISATLFDVHPTPTPIESRPFHSNMLMQAPSFSEVAFSLLKVNFGGIFWGGM